ncbi:acetyl-CoA carboxylase carboxyltransferase subunit alpha [Compostibacter hankyongensis]|uniref:Acetyl-coenzyme A carboxylase carboxyl transferase subunit alpha n=2 Tax=Compostibacter hankyongensis TaxID=1007089 RepID=A0ABP8FXS5_9BACT
MQFLDFEQPIADLYEQLDKVRQIGEKTKVDVQAAVHELEEKIHDTREKIYANLSPWQKVQLSRHPNRPYTLAYIERLCDKFIQLHGDRNVRDDPAMVGGFGEMDGQTIMFIGQQKGINTKMRQLRNFGMANPEGYRKALRLMKLAEKFDKPIVTFIDTPGAYPGLEAEERGQAEAIARNLFEMVRLRVPVICIIIGEGASGGALGIGMGDRVFMLENSWYSVISPENCSAILWRNWDHKEEAAEQLKLTSGQMHKFGIVDGVIPEPLGGAHTHYNEMVATLKAQILETLGELKAISPEKRIKQRIEKFSRMGFFEEA